MRLPGDADRLERAARRRASGGRALRITYYTAARDETTERVVDPMRVLMVGGRAYLEAWCRRAEAVRLFRVDRIDALTELDEPAAVPPQARPHDVTRRASSARRPDLPLVTLRVGPGRAVDHRVLPVRARSEGPGGDQWLVSLRVTDLAGPAGWCSGSAPEVSVCRRRRAGRAGRATEARAALAAYAAPAHGRPAAARSPDA